MILIEAFIETVMKILILRWVKSNTINVVDDKKLSKTIRGKMTCPEQRTYLHIPTPNNNINSWIGYCKKILQIFNSGKTCV